MWIDCQEISDNPIHKAIDICSMEFACHPHNNRMSVALEIFIRSNYVASLSPVYSCGIGYFILLSEDNIYEEALNAI